MVVKHLNNANDRKVGFNFEIDVCSVDGASAARISHNGDLVKGFNWKKKEKTNEIHNNL